MKNGNLVFMVLLAASLTAGFISGWVIKDCGFRNEGVVYKNGGVLKVLDTIKIPVVEYRIIPGRSYNVDSLTEEINKAWKDSLKNLYGKGMFEAKFTKGDNVGKREITLESRIPIDPKAGITIEEELKSAEVYPQREFGIFCGSGYVLMKEFILSAGFKYYLLDLRNFTLTASAGGLTVLNNKKWQPYGSLEIGVRF